MYEGPVFDADNHYYEALDAFTRHLDPRLGPRCVQWCDIDGRKYQVVGGVVSRVVANPTFDPIAKAGAMHDYFRGNPDGRNPLEFLAEREPIRPEYRDRDRAGPRPRRAGTRGLLDVPDARHALRGAAPPRRRGLHPHVHGVQPLGRGGLGLRLPGQDLRRAVPVARRPRLGDRRAGVGARARRPHDRHAPRRAVHAERSAHARQPGVRSVLVTRGGGGHHGRGARGGQRLHGATATRRTASARASRARAWDRASRCCTWSARSTTSSRR